MGVGGFFPYSRGLGASSRRPDVSKSLQIVLYLEQKTDGQIPEALLVISSSRALVTVPLLIPSPGQQSSLQPQRHHRSQSSVPLVADKTGAEQCCSHTLGNQSSELRQESRQAPRVLYLRSVSFLEVRKQAREESWGEGAASQTLRFNNKPPHHPLARILFQTPNCSQ